MIRALVFLAILFAIVWGAGWLATNAGTVEVAWLGYVVTVETGPALIALALFVVATMIVWWLFVAFLSSPKRLGRLFGNQRVKKGRQALSKGLIAVGSGDVRAAKRYASEARRLIPDDPATSYLDSQAAQLSNDRDGARASFERMLEQPETEILGLRGLYIEADRQGALDAKRHFAFEANRRRPGLPWASKAVFDVHVAEGDWEGALTVLDANARNQVQPKSELRRLKAVVLTARALELELRSPDQAKTMVLEAHALLPGFVPAAVLAGRLLTRLGDIRKASRILETTWQASPHPQIAEGYLDVRPGDAALDRLKRARQLAGLRANTPEGSMAVALAAIDAREWSVAREALAAVLRSSPTERSCLLMADVEEGENNDLGRVREWLSRAVRAPKDPLWVADGVASEEWLPVSPVTGELDAFEWKVPPSTDVSAELDIDDSILKSRTAKERASDVSGKSAGASVNGAGQPTAAGAA